MKSTQLSLTNGDSPFLYLSAGCKILGDIGGFEADCQEQSGSNAEVRSWYDQDYT